MMASPLFFPTLYTNMQKLNVQWNKKENQIKLSPHYWLFQLCCILQEKKNQVMGPIKTGSMPLAQHAAIKV